MKLSKAQVSKTIQSGGFFGALLSMLAGLIMKIAARSAKNMLLLLG